MTETTALIVDDQAMTRRLLGKVVGKLGYRALYASSYEEANVILKDESPKVLFGDLTISPHGPEDGIAAIRTLRERTSIGIVVVTGTGGDSLGSVCLSSGADHYLTKPVSEQKIRDAIYIADQRRKIRDKNSRDKPRLRAPFPPSPLPSKGIFDVFQQDGHVSSEEFIGRSAPVRSLLKDLSHVARGDSTVLIVGETGTGKELLARAIHRTSPRSKGPFVPVSIACVPSTLASADLFGAAKGAYTGAYSTQKGKLEAAAGGTLFLDEIGEIALEAQPMLLRLMQEKTYYRLAESKERTADIRMVCATNRDLHAMCREGTFREDLLYRVDVARLTVPPLRDRGDDVILLARHFLARFARSYQKQIRLSDDDHEVLKAYEWPGNVRELENQIERAVVFAPLAKGFANLRAIVSLPESEPPPSKTPLDEATDESLFRDIEIREREQLEEALRLSRGKLTEAASILGIKYETLRYRVRKYGLRPGKRRQRS